MTRNPIVKATIVVFSFWWVVLTIIALGTAVFGDKGIEAVSRAALISLGVTIGGALLGFFGRLAWRSGHSITNESMLKKGAEWNGAISRLGALPTMTTPAMGALPKNLDQLAPWLPVMREKFPKHAAAVHAVVRVMMTEPNLPASPVPGGHGGRTLLQHSLGVVESMLEQAPKWVYRGQFKSDGKTLVVPPRRGEHRFTPEDFGLLILTALAHDIGKVACYKLVGPNTVVETKPNHDIEGGKILRRIPEVMALSLQDRRALLTACSFYHHPFGMPLVEWCDDRVRSLTELLIVADHAAGKKEGHTLRSAPVHDDDDEDEGITALDRKRAAELGAVIGKNIEELEDGSDLFDSEDRMAAAIPAASITAKDSAQAPWEVEDSATSAHEEGAAARAGRSEVSGLYRILAQRSDLINGANVGGRIGFKQGKRVFISEARLRDAVQLSDWDTGLTPDKLRAGPVGREANPFTKRLLTSLAEAGYLLQAIDVPGENRVARFNAISSVFSIRTQTTKSKAPAQIPTPFFVIPTTPFGLDDIQDWPYDIEIVKPFFGWHSEAGKAKPNPTQPASTEETAEEDHSAPAQPTGEQADDDFDSSDYPSSETDVRQMALAVPAPATGGIDDDDIPGFEGAAQASGPSKAELLENLYGELDESEVAPVKIRDNGTRVFYADGAAAAVIARFLASNGLTEQGLGIERKMGGSGRDILDVPKP